MAQVLDEAAAVVGKSCDDAGIGGPFICESLGRDEICRLYPEPVSATTKVLPSRETAKVPSFVDARSTISGDAFPVETGEGQHGST